MEKLEMLIQKYLKKQKPKILHDLRVEARRILSNLEKEGKIDLSLKELLKKSSKLRDIDVMTKTCKDKNIKKYLKKRKKSLLKKFLKYLKSFKVGQITDIKPKIIDCKKVLSESFLGKDDKTLHKIRIAIKRCRYTNNKFEKEYKKLQDLLGKVHDYYNCEKLLKKFNKKNKKISKKKIKFIKKAEKERIYILTLLSSS